MLHSRDPSHGHRNECRSGAQLCLTLVMVQLEQADLKFAYHLRSLIKPERDDEAGHETLRLCQLLQKREWSLSDY